VKKHLISIAYYEKKINKKKTEMSKSSSPASGIAKLPINMGKNHNK